MSRHDRRSYGRARIPEEQEACLRRIRALVLPLLAEDSSGHDVWHAERVGRHARRIAVAEGADEFIVAVAALVHDAFRPDETMSGESHVGEVALARIAGLLREAGVTPDLIPAVVYCVRVHEQYSFHGAPAPESLEASVLQDADRLEALGALGIARTFMYGGRIGVRMWVPVEETGLPLTEPIPGTVIGHFYKKLLKLGESMNTDTAREMAAERHAFMVEYLTRFYEEWYR